LLDTVIGLPEKLFFGTGIPAAILVFRRNKTDNNVLFIDASREYYDGKTQNQLSEDNVAKIVETFRARKDVDRYAYLANVKKIKENDYNLNIPRYVYTFEEEKQIDLATVLAERKTLKMELAQIEAEMEGYLKELGYGA
jgi:type I restriction enzyme M protein